MFGLGLLESLFLLAPFVVVPLGLSLAASFDRREPEPTLSATVTIAQFLGAPLAIAALLAPRGIAAALALGWFVVCAIAGLWGLMRLRRVLSAGLAEACVTAGLLYLPVGGAWFTISRAGAQPMGFTEPIVFLTAVHFHFTAFAGLVLAAAAGREVASEGAGRLARGAFCFAAPCIIAGPGLLAAGWTLRSPALKLVAVHVLVAGFLTVAALMVVAARRDLGVAAQLLLTVSAACVTVGMVLASLYALGESGFAVYLSIPVMARSHGVLNGLGFAVFGLLAWRLAVRVQTRRRDGSACAASGAPL